MPRLHAELDLRSLKQTLQMNFLRCQTPAMVRKEIWVHLLAYNLIRAVMADAAQEYGILPRHLSFKTALESLLAFAPYLALMSSAQAETYYAQLLDAIARHRVGDRSDRYEPRLEKDAPMPTENCTNRVPLPESAAGKDVRTNYVPFG